MDFFSKFLGVTCASVIALGVSSVNASDFGQPGGMKDVPYVAPPTWTGFYAGLNGGGSFGDSNNMVISNNVNWSTVDIGQFQRVAGFGGAQFGYNFAWSDQLIVGLETDVQGSGISEGFARNYLVYNGGTATANGSQEIDFFGTVRARLGYVVGSTLVYGTAGFAYANVNTKIGLNTFTPAGAPNFNNYMSVEEIETGWAAGGGLEYLFTPKLSAKLEYQYIDLGSHDLVGTLPNGRIDRTSVDDSIQTFRVGINYHFTPDYVPLK